MEYYIHWTNNNKRKMREKISPKIFQMRNEYFFTEAILHFNKLLYFHPQRYSTQIDLILSFLSTYNFLIKISLARLSANNLNLFVDFAFSILSHVCVWVVTWNANVIEKKSTCLRDVVYTSAEKRKVTDQLGINTLMCFCNWTLSCQSNGM